MHFILKLQKSLYPAFNTDVHDDQLSDIQTDRQTDRPRFFVCSSGPHLAVAAMQHCFKKIRLIFGNVGGQSLMSLLINGQRSVVVSTAP